MAHAIRFIISSSDTGAGKKGAADGPDALITALSRRVQLDYPISPVQNAVASGNSKYTWAKHIDFIQPAMENLATETEKVLSASEFPIILTGDHSNAIGSISGFKDFFQNETIGVIWVDAHYDLHSPYTTPSGNLHGMPLNVLLGHDNTENQLRTPDSETVAVWERLKRTGQKQISPKLRSENLIFIGVRDYEKPEELLANTLGLKNHTVAECRAAGMNEIAEIVNEKLSHCTAIYVSFDVDSMDPSVSRATGTPVPGGFYPEEIIVLLQRILQNPKVRALEVTEINPHLEENEKMSAIVADILDQVMGIAD